MDLETMENIPEEEIRKPIENLSKKPRKSILKAPSSSNMIEASNNPSQLIKQSSQDKDLKWDETNILQTFHPVNKDYGHMKIEEPKTPYSYCMEDDEGQCHSDTEMPQEIDAENLAKMIEGKAGRLSASSSKSRFSFDRMDEDPDFADDDDDFELRENETEEERDKRREFEQKRKKHYNEYQMVKLARELLKDEDDEEED